MQKQKTDQGTEEDAVGKILESKDVLEGIDANVLSVEMKTRIEKTEYIKGVFKKDKDDIIVMDEKIDQENLQKGSYVSQDTIQNAVKSDFVNSEVIYDRDTLRHVNEDTVKNRREVIIHANPSEGGVEPAEKVHEFYRCEVEHVVELTVSDKWNRGRKLEKRFNSYQSALSFLNYVKQIEDCSVELSHDGDHFVIGSDETNSVSESRYISTIKRSVISGLFIGIVTSILGFGFLVAILSTSLIIMLDIMNAYSVSNKNDEFYFAEGTEKPVSTVNIEDLRSISVIEEFDEDFSVKVEEDKVEVIPDSLDTKWTLDTMSNNLPDSNAVEFFEDVGLENLGDKGKFTSKVQKRNTEPEDPSYVSECGYWYLYPEKKDDDI